MSDICHYPSDLSSSQYHRKTLKMRPFDFFIDVIPLRTFCPHYENQGFDDHVIH